MPFLYVYSPSDFVSLPDESGAQAAGSATFTLTLVAGASPTIVEVSDDDLIFDEIDGTQEIVSDVIIDGTTYLAGTTINTAYDLINTTTGHQVTSFHFDSDGYVQGPVDGLVSTVPLTEGTSYTFDTERTSHTQNNLYENYEDVPCFTSGTIIETERGAVEVQDLVTGDMILTLDHGFQPLRLVMKRTLSSVNLKEYPKLFPICILAGALGDGLPKRDLLISPQHRFLTNSPIAKRMFGSEQVLISSKKMTVLPGIFVNDGVDEVEYVHLVMDQHEIIFAENTPTESFFCGPMALRGLESEAVDELEIIFPELKQKNFLPQEIRPIPSGRRQKQFVARQVKNRKSILTRSTMQ
jgi:hypothetical protein